MPKDASDKVKRQAAAKVLDSVGGDMNDILTRHLRDYDVSLDPAASSPFSLEQLHFGLSVLFGDSNANNILQQIVEQIEEIQRQELRIAGAS
ncbi:MAG TPA: hypothetical protein VJL54_02410 [Nitrososphaera sp.]|nr:hypothetical protein [Nitrososphaera sp.]